MGRLLHGDKDYDNWLNQARKDYLNALDGIIDLISDDIEKTLAKVTKDIQDGWNKTLAAYNALPPGLQEKARQALERIAGKYSELVAKVEEEQASLVQTVADLYTNAVQELDAKIAELREAHKGLFQRAFEFIKGVIDTIKMLAELLFKVLARVAGVIGDILKDPIGFFGNLVNAVKTGLGQFVKNFVRHLEGSLVGWITGELGLLGLGGLKLDPAGLFRMVLEVLGVTWANVRDRAVRLFGAKVVASVETTSELFKTLVREGPVSLWNQVAAQIGDFRALIVEPLVSYVLTGVIQRGIARIVTMFVPAGGFIAACRAIIDIFRFLTERASQIIAFVNSVLDSLVAIARGAVQSASDAIEQSLANGVTLAISFLATLAGVSGIGSRIRSIFQKVRAPVNAAIDAVLRPILTAARLAIQAAARLAARAAKKVRAGVRKATKTKRKPPGRPKPRRDLVRASRVKGARDRDAERRKALHLAMNEAVRGMNRFSDRPVSRDVLNRLLAPIRDRFGLKSLAPVPSDDHWSVIGASSPGEERATSAKRKPSKKQKGNDNKKRKRDDQGDQSDQDSGGPPEKQKKSNKKKKSNGLKIEYTPGSHVILLGRPKFNAIAKKMKPTLDQDRRHVLGWDDFIRPSLEEAIRLKLEQSKEKATKRCLVELANDYSLPRVPAADAEFEKVVVYITGQIFSATRNLFLDDNSWNQAIEQVRQDAMRAEEEVKKKAESLVDHDDPIPKAKDVRDILKNHFRLRQGGEWVELMQARNEIYGVVLKQLDEVDVTSNDYAFVRLMEIVFTTRDSTGFDIAMMKAQNEMAFRVRQDFIDAQTADKKLEAVFSLLGKRGKKRGKK